ncbi:hypothetical protein WJX77_000259 [Trebouxia sp. C0004]
MSTMLRTLLRSTSDRQSDGGTKGSLSMPSSPSFSDFSMGCGQEEFHGEDVHSQSLPSQPAQSSWSRRTFGHSTSRGSTDSSSSSEGDYDQQAKGITAGRSAGVAIPQADRAQQNHFIPAVARHVQAATPPKDVKPPRQTYPEKKIDGMDYYEFCELIRSNSL